MKCGGRYSSRAASAEENAIEAAQQAAEIFWPERHAPAQRPHAALGEDALKAVLEDFIPPSYPTEIELQNLVAVLECTSKGLLPEKYRAMDRGELIERTNQLAFLTRR